MTSPMVLIVDDEPDVIQALKFRLETAGYETLTASSGAEALDQLHNHNVDLLLTDLMMPEIDGLELTRLVKANPSWTKTKILAFSCATDEKSRKDILTTGALDFLPKSVGANSIVTRVYEILGAADATLPSVVDYPRAAENDPGRGLRTISEGIADRLRRARKVDGIPPETRAARDSVDAPLQDLINLAQALDSEN